MNSTMDQEALAREETDALISSEEVDGTVVYDPQGERIGSVKHLMIGKRDGRVRYAVLTFGGLFGIGERYYPLPWQELEYDERQGGYVVNRTREEIEGSPSYEPGAEPPFNRTYHNQVYGYYGVPW